MSSLTLFPVNSRIIKVLLTFRPLRIALAPWFPRLFHLKSSVSRAWFALRAFAMNYPASGPISLLLRSTFWRDLFSPTATRNFWRPISVPLPNLFHSKEMLLKVDVVRTMFEITVIPSLPIEFPLSSISVTAVYFCKKLARTWHPSSPMQQS